MKKLLLKHGNQPQQVAWALEHEDPVVRMMAVDGFGERKEWKRWSHVVARRLNDDVWQVRLATARALLAMNNKRSVEKLDARARIEKNSLVKAALKTARDEIFISED